MTTTNSCTTTATSRKRLWTGRNVSRRENGCANGLFEPCAVKAASTVLRGEGSREAHPPTRYWTALSGGSRLVTDAVARIRQGIEVFGVGNGGFWYMADALIKGASFPELILVGTDEHAPLVLLEGHVRLTTYFLRPDCIPQSLPVIVGYAAGMVK